MGSRWWRWVSWRVSRCGERAKAVLARHKERHEYVSLVNELAYCHKGLHHWNEAAACYQELVELVRNLHGTNHPEYAAALSNLAALLLQLKQFEEAILRYEEALSICQRVFATSTSSLSRSPMSLAFVGSWSEFLVVSLTRATTSACAAAAVQSLSTRWFALAFARGTATLTASSSTGQRTSRLAPFAFTATLF
jgi:tetratricopeptide (TPR) repeat protein